MMPRKKRKTIIIISIVAVIFIMLLTLLLLYIKTDNFKSNKTLFIKYMKQNLDNVEEIYQNVGISSFEEILNQNKYTSKIQVKNSYVENIGTSLENAKNSINQLKITVDGQTDKANGYNYQDIQILNDEQEVAQLEYIQKKNQYGIRFTDLFNQYILVENENLKKLFRKLRYNDEQLKNIPDTIQIDNKEIKNVFEFSKQEIENIKNKYIGIINNNISKDNFSKQKNQTVVIDDKNTQVNAYILTLTKEQLNNIFLKILEEMKQDEIILNKMDKVQEVLKKYKIVNNETDFRKQFAKKIEDNISEITKNNIGTEQTQIIVYENRKTTVSTMIKATNYETYMDILPYKTQNYIQISYKDTTPGKEKEKICTYKKINGKTSIIFSNQKEGQIVKYSLENEEKEENNKYLKNTIAKFDDGKNRLETKMEKEINLVDEFKNEIVLNNENSVNLTTMEEDEARGTFDKAKVQVGERANKIITQSINMEDIGKVLKVIGFTKEAQALQALGISETEKNRFNSQFEILKGEKLDNTEVLRVIEAIKNNLVDMEVVSNTQLKLKLDRLSTKEELSTTLSTFIEKNKQKKYNVEIEHDEITGLVNYVVLTMLEK